MRVALISDIHGNAFAFDLALADIRQREIDQIVCLGDAIQGGAQPVETVQRLRELGCPVVMGNADAWMLTGKETGNESVSAMQETVRQWSLSKLSPDDQSFIAAFVPTLSVPMGQQGTLLCFHGSPTSFDDIILPTTPYETILQHFGGVGARWFTGGHTHLQQVRRVGDGFFFNPGSVGLAYSHDQSGDDPRLDPWAEYAILTVTDDTVGLEFRKVGYAASDLIAILRQTDHPNIQKSIQEYGG